MRMWNVERYYVAVTVPGSPGDNNLLTVDCGVWDGQSDDLFTTTDRDEAFRMADRNQARQARVVKLKSMKMTFSPKVADSFKPSTIIHGS